MELRDKYFTRLKQMIEIMVNNKAKAKAVVLGHSMGANVFYYFLKWVESDKVPLDVSAPPQRAAAWDMSILPVVVGKGQSFWPSEHPHPNDLRLIRHEKVVGLKPTAGFHTTHHMT